MKKAFSIVAMALIFTVLFLGCEKKDEGAGAAKRTFVTIGTGGVTGVYYPTGGAISKMVNQKFDSYGIKATVESTAGSVFNVNAILAGDLEFGIVQSDRQYQAFKGMADWKDVGAQDKLRAVFSIHPESVTMLAADDSGIQNFEDIKGKIINIGAPGSGQRGNAIDIMEVYGIDWEKDIKAEGLKPAEAAKMLQDGRIDAYFYTVGHPNGSFKEATSGSRKAHFVAITETDSLLKLFPFYAASFIPVKEYPNASNDGDVQTFGVKATLCTSSDVPDDVVYAITKEVFENLDDFKKLHPAFAVLTAESMLDGLSAPIHDGAMKYFKEAGLK
ncbi:MAG: C4-dicarboxylate ABC transporter substrate-binding protein [Spirochaetaceae bacterium 4572_59]|nr:MAG: C4-dicarboxylate ABC transporter substrate-binding protein [Spirochaetaceae bacterium 4572_59]